MLVPFSMEKASPVGKSFVAPIHDDGKMVFVSLSTLKPIEFGAVVYVGRDVSVEDVFAKIVESGTKVLPSVDEQISVLQDYLDCLPKLKIGDVVRLGFDSDGSVQLEKQKKPKPNKGNRNLP
ncbi:hypothetical protein RKLH11_3981 [Rhodobacteraceae bacterium KLH11]|nr:hypothetical protein RKLH11_4348 [Rhodobacteraceae bacterium KLH11]EEE35305.1 hypothetical protein RKLH11_3981 [Rhodobacteraceae bacterium KLH11]